jgi:anti-sigma factor RsiW
MCDNSGKLIAWLDGELGHDDMAELGRHIDACRECRSKLASYKQVSATFDAYCDAVVSAKTHPRKLPRWVPVLTTATAAAIAAMFVLLLLRARVEPAAVPRSVQVQSPQIQAPPVVVVEKTSVPSNAVHRQRPAARAPRQTTNWQPTGRAIQISIPAESMFPPGAVPEGVNFVADLSIAPDGSAEQIRLRPRLIEVQRRQP